MSFTRHVTKHAIHKKDDKKAMIRELNLFHNCILLENKSWTYCASRYLINNMEWDQEDVFWATRLYGYDPGFDTTQISAAFSAEGRNGRPRQYKKYLPGFTPQGTTVPSCRFSPLTAEEDAETSSASRLSRTADELDQNPQVSAMDFADSNKRRWNRAG